MLTLTRADQRVPDDGVLPSPLTWDRTEPQFHVPGCEQDFALCTCAKGHTCRMTARIHSVAPDGTVTPSYVCPVDGCGFHDWVRLEGWPG